MSEQKTIAALKAMSAAIIELSEQLTAHRDQTNQRFAHLSQSIQEVVENITVADGVSRKTAVFVSDQIQAVFSNEVMLDSNAAALLTRQLNAIRFVAASSENRQASLVILQDYVPGSQRVTLSDTGEFKLEQQVVGSKNQYEGWELDPVMTSDPDAVDGFRQLMLAEGCEANVAYYLIDDISLQNWKSDLARQQQELVQRHQREDALRDADQPAQNQTESSQTVEDAQFVEFEEPQAPETTAKPEDQPAVSKLDALRDLVNEL